MFNFFKSVSVCLLLGASTTSYAAGDIAAGKAKAATCMACHGAAGCSATDIWPNLAAQKAGYLVKQLKEFKAGKRKNASMAPMVAPLTEADMVNLAAYYASLPGCKGKSRVAQRDKTFSF